MKETINDIKPIMRVLLLANLIVCYFVNLICMFMNKPFEILIANIVVWLIMIIIPLGIAFVFWLND